MNSLFLFSTRFFLLSTLLLTTSGAAGAQTPYLVLKGETLSSILRSAGFPSDYAELLPFIKETINLNPELLSHTNPDYLSVNTAILLPENPFLAKPEPVITMVPVPKVIPTVEIQAVSVGKAIVLRGTYKIERDQQQSAATSGDRLYEGDKIITNSSSMVRLEFADESEYVLGSKSEFEINRFLYQEENTESGFIATMKLIIGAVSAKSGIIGKAAPDRYRLDTPLATVGIRGTEYTVRYCEVECGHYPGVTAAVTEGAIDFTNNATSIPINPNEFVAIASANEEPLVMPIPEGFLDLEQDLSGVEDNRSFWQKIIDYIKS